MIRQFIIGLVCFFIFTFAHANPNSPIGEWITISDKTHDRSGVVRIFEQNGKLYGKIIKIFPGADRDPNELCTKCGGSLKNKPILGMVFLTGFARQADGTWKDGKVLDPKDGKVYRGTITLIDNGQKLELRGYWGVFWRTQTWIRANYYV